MKKTIQPKFRTAYNLGNENYSEKHSDDGLTEQHHADTCDINKILAQFMETGILPTSTNKDPQYGDVSEHDFQEVQNQLAQAKTLFEGLPDPVKAQFDNKPFKFLHFAEDPKNMDSLVEMGLANAPTPHLEDNALPSGGIIPSNSKAVPGTIPKATTQNESDASTVAT